MWIFQTNINVQKTDSNATVLVNHQKRLTAIINDRKIEVGTFAFIELMARGPAANFEIGVVTGIKKAKDGNGAALVDFNLGTKKLTLNAEDIADIREIMEGMKSPYVAITTKDGKEYSGKIVGHNFSEGNSTIFFWEDATPRERIVAINAGEIKSITRPGDF